MTDERLDDTLDAIEEKWNPQLRQHVFFCANDSHERVTQTLQCRIGESPETPTCSECGAVMKKDWGAVTVRYSRSWYNQNPLKKRGKASNRL